MRRGGKGAVAPASSLPGTAPPFSQTNHPTAAKRAASISTSPHPINVPKQPPTTNAGEHGLSLPPPKTHTTTPRARTYQKFHLTGPRPRRQGILRCGHDVSCSHVNVPGPVVCVVGEWRGWTAQEKSRGWGRGSRSKRACVFGDLTKATKARARDQNTRHRAVSICL